MSESENEAVSSSPFSSNPLRNSNHRLDREKSTAFLERASPISDAQISLVASLIPQDKVRFLACDCLGLTDTQYDNLLTPINTVQPGIVECLKLGLERQNIANCAELKKCLEKAAQKNTISFDAVRVIGSNLRASAMNDDTLLALSSYVLPNNTSFLECILRLTRGEIEQRLPSSLSIHKGITDLISLWREQNVSKNSAKDFVNALERSCFPSEQLTKIKEIMEDMNTSEIACMHSMNISNKKKIVKEIASILSSFYKNQCRTICPLPWVEGAERYSLDEVFITLYVEEQSTIKCLKKKKKYQSVVADVSINKIFSCHAEESNRRILIHGEPGSGKSMLATKLAWDWANRNTDIKHLADFELVFVIRVCLLAQEESLFNYIRREYFSSLSDIAWQEYLAAIKNSSLLLVFDGYDELQITKDIIEETLTQLHLNTFTAVLTSRYGATSALIRSVSFDICYGLKKLRWEDVQTFITMYADDETQKSLSRIHAEQHPYTDILSTPLYLWFYVLLGVEYFSDIKHLTKTHFFSQVIKGILDKALIRLSISEFDVASRLFSLQAMAYNCMERETLQVTIGIDSIDNITCNLGFLNKMISRRGISACIVYMFTHKTILEYLCAKYIVETSKHKESMVNMLQRVPEIRDPRKRAASVLLPFVVGLISDGQHEGTIHPQDVLREFRIKDLFRDHSHHIVLQCIAECREGLTFSFEFLSKAIGKETRVSELCTQYCKQGLMMLKDNYTYTHMKYSPETRTCIAPTTADMLRLSIADNIEQHISKEHNIALEIGNPKTSQHDGEAHRMLTFVEGYVSSESIKQIIMYDLRACWYTLKTLPSSCADSVTSVYIKCSMQRDIIERDLVFKHLKHVCFYDDYHSLGEFDIFDTFASVFPSVEIVEYAIKHNYFPHSVSLLLAFLRALRKGNKNLKWKAVHLSAYDYEQTFGTQSIWYLNPKICNIYAIPRRGGELSSGRECIRWLDLGEEVDSPIHNSEEGQRQKQKALEKLEKLKNKGYYMADDVIREEGWSSEEYIFVYKMEKMKRTFRSLLQRLL